MDKHTYITRLKKMLIRFPNTSCSHCPIAKNYNNEISKVSTVECKMCQSFVGLKYESKWSGGNHCPCYRPNPETAVARAWKYIRKYEEKHGEIPV